MAFPRKREKIAETVRRWLEAGRYKPGERFPSDRELAERFGVTHVTVRGALEPLVEAGVLERRIGAGTVVRAPDTRPEAAALAGAVGIAIPDTTFSFFNDILAAVENALHPTGRPLVLGHTWELGEREESIVARWLALGIERLILVPTVPRAGFYRELLGRGLRLVLVDRDVPGLDAPGDPPKIVSRDREGARLVTRHLIELGHRRIVHLAGKKGASTADARIAGFEAACEDARVPASRRAIVAAGFFLDDGYRATRALLAKGPPPDAIFAANDPVAVGALRALAEDGLEVPRDVSVAGYGDTDLGRNFQLTSVRQHPERMGAEAVRLLLSTRAPNAANSVVIEPELIVRASTTHRRSRGEASP